MNSDVHPAVVALVLMLTAVAIATWMWGSGAAASIGGPAELKSDPGGHAYVQIQNYLVEHDSSGDYVQTHDLTSLDVELFLGAYAFFSNGDILLRRGPDPRSFGDNFRAFQRKTNQKSITPERTDSGLFRCDLAGSTCTRFGAKGIDFKAAHGVFIDWSTDDVFISDTTRHLLRKYSADGTELAKPVGGFKFPNQLLVHDDMLYVVDTNHHVVKVVSRRTETFGESVESLNVVPAAATKEFQRWPSHFARVGNAWWVNNMQTGMNRGGIYIFDDGWHFDRKADLPADADPISLLPVGDNVWVSDWNNDSVRRFTASGEALPDLVSEGLEVILATSRLERRKYELISYSGIALIVFVLLALMVRALAARMNEGPVGPSGRDAVGEEQEPGASLYLEPDDKAIRRMAIAVNVAVLLAFIIVALLVYIMMLHDKPEFGIQLIVPMAGMLGMVLLIAWLNRANTGTSISLQANLVTLRDHTGRESSCPVREVRYDDTAIATPDAVVFLGRPMASVYKRKLLKERLIPQLSAAKKVGPFEMMKILVELRHPQGVITLIATIGLVIYAVWAVAVR